MLNERAPFFVVDDGSKFYEIRRLEAVQVLSLQANAMRCRVDSAPILRFVAALRAGQAGPKMPEDHVCSPEATLEQPLHGSGRMHEKT